MQEAPYLGEAAGKAAAYNVKINLPGVIDETLQRISKPV